MALAYVRTIDFTASDMGVLFNDNIDIDVGIANVSIVPSISSVATPEIKSVSVADSLVTITFSPLFSGIKYKVTFTSTTSQNFQTDAGEIISEDGSRNSFFVISPGEESEIRDSMFDDVGSTYDTDEPTLVKDLITSMASELERASDSVKTVHASNYLSVLIEDELKTRGNGPTDKLDNGGTFQILRVASTPTSSVKSDNIKFNSSRLSAFGVRDGMYTNSVLSTTTLDPISVQASEIINEEISDDTSEANFFDGLRIKALKCPIIQVISVSLQRDNYFFEYDIEKFGYTLKSNRYDTNSASTNVNLENNEIDLSSDAITGFSGSFTLPRAGDRVFISYIYKNPGREVTASSIVFSRTVSVVRETIDALANKFSLDYFPIVTQSDVVASLNAIDFLNTPPEKTLRSRQPILPLPQSLNLIYQIFLLEMENILLTMQLAQFTFLEKTQIIQALGLVLQWQHIHIEMFLPKI